MKASRVVLAVTFVAALVSTAFAQQGPPPMPKPGPEHDVLKMDIGTWDAVVEMMTAPGAPPMKSKGVEVNTLGCGGLCVITDFKGDLMPGVTFHGHGLMTWDATKKKYVGTWTDSMSTGLAMTEGTYDAKAKKFEGWMEGPDATGKVMKSRSVVEYRPDGSRVMTAYTAGPDGKEMEMLKITTTKRK